VAAIWERVPGGKQFADLQQLIIVRVYRQADKQFGRRKSGADFVWVVTALVVGLGGGGLERIGYVYVSIKQ
jgi:hypothetical protein